MRRFSSPTFWRPKQCWFGNGFGLPLYVFLEDFTSLLPPPFPPSPPLFPVFLRMWENERCCRLFLPFFSLFSLFSPPLPICGKTGAAVFPPPLYIACYEKTAERGKRRRRRKEWRGEEEERELFLLLLVFLSVSRIVREEIRPLKKKTFDSLDHKMQGRSNI